MGMSVSSFFFFLSSPPKWLARQKNFSATAKIWSDLCGGRSVSHAVHTAYIMLHFSYFRTEQPNALVCFYFQKQLDLKKSSSMLPCVKAVI